MIKPNTMCMIRGVPNNMPGWDCNGKIVQVKEVVFDAVWRFEPPVQTQYDKSVWSIDLSEAKFLHPLDPCEDDLAHETLERIDDQMRETFINTVLEKI